MTFFAKVEISILLRNKSTISILRLLILGWFFINVEISIHLWLACRRSDEVVDDLDGDRGCDIEVEDEMEAMEHIELLREPIEGDGVVGGVA